MKNNQNRRQVNYLFCGLLYKENDTPLLPKGINSFMREYKPYVITE